MDITATLKISKNQLTYKYAYAQIQLPQFLLFYTSKKNMTGTRQIIWKFCIKIEHKAVAALKYFIICVKRCFFY